MSGLQRQSGMSATVTAQGGLTGRIALPQIASFGGVTSWNDLTDKPFYTAQQIGEVLPETTAIYMEEMDAFVLRDEYQIIPGEQYTVTYNEKQLTMQAGQVTDGIDEESITVVYLGNIGAMGMGEDTGDPFLLLYIPPEYRSIMGLGDVTTMLLPLDGAQHMNIRIMGRVTVVHTLDPQYLPPLRCQNTIVLNLDDQSCEMPFAEVLKLDAAQLQASVSVVLDSVTYSVDAVKKEEQTLTMYLHLTQEKVMRVTWSADEIMCMTYHLIAVPPEAAGSVRVPVEYQTNYKWLAPDKVTHEGLILKSTQSDTYFYITVNDTGVLSIQKDANAPYDR